MKKWKIIFLSLISIFFISPLYSQKQLNVQRFKINKVKTFSVYEAEVLTFKKAGSNKFLSKKIIALQDSVIVFEDETEIRFDQIKAIRLYKANHLVSTFQFAFSCLAVGFFPLNTMNQLITNNEPVISGKAALVSTAMFGAVLIMSELNFIRVRINRRNTLKFTEINYGDLKSTNDRRILHPCQNH